MQKDLYIKETFPVRHDDLKFDRNNMIIPFYWAGSILEYLEKVNTTNMDEGDVTDLNELKKFVADVVDFRQNEHDRKSAYHFEGTN